MYMSETGVGERQPTNHPHPYCSYTLFGSSVLRLASQLKIVKGCLDRSDMRSVLVGCLETEVARDGWWWTNDRSGQRGVKQVEI